MNLVTSCPAATRAANHFWTTVPLHRFAPGCCTCTSGRCWRPTGNPGPAAGAGPRGGALLQVWRGMSGKARACGCLRCGQLWGGWRQDLPRCCSSQLSASRSLQMTLCSLRRTSNLWITAGVRPLCSASLSTGLSSTWPSLSRPQASERKITNQWS